VTYDRYGGGSSKAEDTGYGPGDADQRTDRPMGNDSGARPASREISCTDLRPLPGGVK